jgi:mannose PTS system EIIA component
MQTPHPHKTKIVVVAHEPLASALLAVVQHVHGHLPAHVLAVDVTAHETPEHTQQTIATFVQGDQALVLTDLPGATPHNCASVACESLKNVLMLSPVSAPLLLRAVNYSDLPAQALYDKLSQG